MAGNRRILLEQSPRVDDECWHRIIHAQSVEAPSPAQSGRLPCHHVAPGGGINGTNYAQMHDGSPIPYLLAGLAAMLALIAVSLFILACSYWKLVGCVEQHVGGAQGGHVADPGAIPGPSGGGGGDSADPTSSKLVSNPGQSSPLKVAVIMAGHSFPTFIAQPMAKIEMVTPPT